MARTLKDMAAWAVSQPDAPPSVWARVRLQHLSAAATARSFPSVGAALGKMGGQGARDRLRVQAGLLGQLELDDHMIFGNPAAGVAAAWAAAEGHTVEEVLGATMVANEVAGRVAAALFFGPWHGQAMGTVHAVAAATAAGVLHGLDADQLAHALARAVDASSVGMSSGGAQPALFAGGLGKAGVIATPAVQGWDAMLQAQEGATGPLGIFDDGGGAIGGVSGVPLRAAFTGLGKAWFTETLAFKLHPGHAFAQVPVQAVHEILARHVRAADKRLRVDQVARIRVHATAPVVAWAERADAHPGVGPGVVANSIARMVGVAIVSHEAGLESFDATWLQANEEQIQEVAAKVEITHDWERSLDLLTHLVDVAAPLFAGLTLGELRVVGQQMGGGLAAPCMRTMLRLLRARPDRMLKRIKYSTGDLADARLDQWQPRYGAEVVLETIRGGAWPERRALPEGAPGWPWKDTITRVEGRWGEGAASLRCTEGSAGASSWVDALLA